MERLWLNRIILHWDNIKLFAPDAHASCCSSQCKGVLGPFQTSMMDFFPAKSTILATVVTSTWQLENIIL